MRRTVSSLGPRAAGEPLSVVRPQIGAGIGADHDYSSKDVLAALFKRKVAIGALALAVATLVAVVTFAMPKIYEARASVLVKFGREYVVRSEVGEARPQIAMTPEEVLNSEVEILTSDDLVRGVIETIGLPRLFPRTRISFGDDLPALDEAARSVSKALRVEAVRRSSVIQVAFEHRDPAVAADVVNLLVERYKEKHVEVFGEQRSGFAEVQLAAYAEKLKDAERKLEGFRQKHRVFAYDQQMEMLLRRKGELDSARRDALVKIGELRQGLDSMNGTLDRSSYAPEVRSGVKRDVIRMQADEQSFRSREASLASLLHNVEKQIRELDLNERELQALKRDLADSERNYQTFKAKAEELRLSADLNQMKVSNISVIHSASVPTSSTKPRVKLNLALGVALGLLTGLIYAIVAEYLSQGMSTPHGAERRLQLPVLVAVPHKRA
jgi:uncharacterized protein involved in exopolysaccharide biosynthesis